jgi:hypothetical protein
MINETPDMYYPLLADVYYPIIEQDPYGAIKKQWVLDKTISCFFGPAGRKFKEDVMPKPDITIDNSMVGRTKNDITVSDRGSYNSLTNIVITNIRDTMGNPIYTESGGPRVGKSTLFEIATFNPILSPFGGLEFYKVVIRRSDNQALDL